MSASHTRLARRLLSPAVALALPVAAITWAGPQGLPPWRAFGVAAGWAGLGLVVASLLLMVREPHVAEVMGGLETMYRWHHRSGAAGYVLLLCHPLALAMDGLREGPWVAWATLSPWLQSWPAWLGWISLALLMAGLATTFAVHLAYRRWRAFHFALALGVIVGILHVYALLAGPLLLLVLSAAALVALGWRFVVSDIGALAHPYGVEKVAHPTSNMLEATLVPYAASLAVRPGQFVLAAFGEDGYRGCGEYHPFTVSAIEANGRLRVAIKALGACSTQLQRLEPGAVARLQGPFGSFLAERSDRPQLWVAGGIGITPFLAVLRGAPLSQPTTLIYLYRNAAEAAFVDELTAHAKTDSNLELVTRATGKDPPKLRSLIEGVRGMSTRDVYVCGPAPMVEALKRELARQGLGENVIHYESFDFR